MPDVDKLLNAIDAAAETAYGSDENGDLARDRAAAIDRYLGRNIAPAPDGRSQVVDRSVYETVQWILPSLSRIFANGDDVVEIIPLGPDDEEQAKQEAAYLNYVTIQKNNWFETFTTAAKDALLTKAGYIYAHRDKRRTVEIERYERQTQEGIALIMQEQPEVLSLNEYPDPDYQPQPLVQPDPMTGQPVPVIGPDGQPVMQPPPMLYDLEVRRTHEDGAFCLRVLPPERVLVSERTPHVQLKECDYFEYFDYCAISDLRSEGYDVEDDIASDHEDMGEEDLARDQYYERNEDYNPVDPARRRVRKRHVWIRHDYDDDGISELQYCVVVGKELLHREEVSRIPVAVFCPDPLPHRHVGLSVADVTIDIQDIKTSILRQGLDNLYLTNNTRTFVDGSMVNLDDLLVNRPGGLVRGKPGAVFGQHIAPMPVPFVFPQAIEALGFMEQVTEGRTGVNRYFQGTDQNALNKTATGIQQLSTMAAQRVEQIARNFANGVETLFEILHELVLKGGHAADVVKLRGKWQQVNPATWRRRQDFRISVGYAAGNKDSMVARLMMIRDVQEKGAAFGVVQPQNMYETAIELVKASDFSAPERFFTDPSTMPPQPPPPNPLVEVEQVKGQFTLQAKGAELQQKDREAAAKLDVEKYKADLDAQVKLQIEALKAEHAAQLEQVKAGTAVELEHHKANLNPKTHEVKAQGQKVKQDGDFIAQFVQSQAQQTQLILQTIETLADKLERMSGPKRVVRGKDGRVEGVVPANE